MITCTSTSQVVATKLSQKLTEPLVDLGPDGSIQADNAEDVDSDERVIVVASTTSSGAHLELLELQERAAARDPSEIVTVLPYMGYARQDKRFQAGEPISARAAARAISTATDQVYVVNPHDDAILAYFDVTAEPIDVAPQLAKSLPARLSDPIFLGPDADAEWLARSARDSYGAGHVDNFEKVRHSPTEVEIQGPDVDFAGSDVVLVDDMIATGGTMSEAVDLLNRQGPENVYVACIHPLLVGDALSKLHRAGVASIYATDTLDRAVSNVSVADPVAAKL